jgi:hypothetical protein
VQTIAVDDRAFEDDVRRRLLEEALGHAGRHGICSLLDRKAHIRANSRQESPCFQQAARRDLLSVASKSVSVDHRRVSHSTPAIRSSTSKSAAMSRRVREPGGRYGDWQENPAAAPFAFRGTTEGSR